MTAEKTTMAFGRRVYGLGVMAFGMGLPGVGGLRPGAALLVHGPMLLAHPASHSVLSENILNFAVMGLAWVVADSFAWQRR
jgi:hypothetical protein